MKKSLIFIFIFIFIFSACTKKKVKREGTKQFGKLSEMRLYIQFEKIEDLWRAGNFKEAISFCKKYLKENPYAKDRDKAQFGLAYLYYDFMNTERNYREAIEEFNKVIINYPQTELKDETYYWIGLCYHNLGNFENALKSYEKLMFDFPNSIWTYGGGFVWNGAVYHIAHIYEIEYLDYEQALLFYLKIIKNTPGIEWKDRVIEKIDKIFRMMELKVMYHFPLIGYEEMVRNWKLQEFDKIMKECKTILQTQKEGEGDKIEFVMAFIQFDYRNKKRNLIEAKNKFSSFLKKYSSSAFAPDAQYWLGMIEWEQNKFQQAIDEFQKVVQNFPNSKLVNRAKLRIGRIYEKELNNFNLATLIYEKILLNSQDESLLKTVKIYKDNLTKYIEKEK